MDKSNLSRPEMLIDQIVRTRIFSNPYWKEECHGVDGKLVFVYRVRIEETLIDRAIKIECIGGTYGGNSYPTKFLCLLLKMLQIQPSLEVTEAYIKNEDYKYIRALGAFYLRLTGTPTQIFGLLEPLYNDFSKLRVMNNDGSTLYLVIFFT